MFTIVTMTVMKKLALALMIGCGLFLFVGAGVSHAANNTWKPTSGTNWNTAANWSLGHTPSPTDVLIFSASSTTSSTINASFSVAGIIISSTYTGTITQSSGNNLTIGSSGYSQSGGVFTGSSGTSDSIDVGSGSFSLTGGTFTSTKGTLYLATSTFSGGDVQ